MCVTFFQESHRALTYLNGQPRALLSVAIDLQGMIMNPVTMSRTSITLAVIALFGAGCSTTQPVTMHESTPPVSYVGPAGPSGPAGASGPKGATGATGA